MLNPESLKADDRLLVIGIPSALELEALAAKVGQGLLVATGDDAAVREARRQTAHLDNVMLTPADGDQLPWRDAFFTVVLALTMPSPALQLELQRVTAPQEETTR